MPWDLGAGVAAAAGAGAGLIGDSIKRERNLEDATNLEALKSKIEQDKQARVAAVLAGVSRTKSVGSFDEMGTPTTVEQAKPEAEYRRERGDVLSKAGMINEADREYNRADVHEDRSERRDMAAAAQKSADEKWKATHEETKRFHDATIRQQAAQLGLKAHEAKDFAAVSDSYVTNKSEYERLVALKDDPDLIAAAKQQMEKDALKLKQFRVDVGDNSVTSQRMQLASALNSTRAVIKDLEFSTEPDAKARKDEAVRTERILVKRMGELGGGGQADGGADKYTVGQVVSTPKGDMEYLGDNKWRASTAGSKISEPVTADDYRAAEAAQSARKSKLQADEDARIEAQRKRGEEIDVFNARMKQR